ncbi:uncharacterized protein LOC106649704 isoform X1 [Trichogramma pretiosum]|uniref:uncharacterized protein LOC106649704 isoform X1 n=2 Tax=Trichogramma pretiosum TaxID=7493 RepID=UPI0006C97CA1|nr:uncharacterized protein LOC106649704 isoform X1 [Trichogramma pretiosum]
MDSVEAIGKEVHIRVSHWIRSFREMRRRTSPVQQWVDSIPSPIRKSPNLVRQHSVSVDTDTISTPETSTIEPVIVDKENSIKNSNMTVSTPVLVPSSPTIIVERPSNVSRLARDRSFQSDSSRCSSVEYLLEHRRMDPEEILMNLGFGGSAQGPSEQAGPLARIPKRFLQPSRLRGIVIEDFVKHQQETSESLDSTSLGYRGLTGSPYVAPSEIVQKIMQRLREHENQELQENSFSELPNQDPDRLSVLSPDNRSFLNRPRSKSPDLKNKRMIIGERSYGFDQNGDLVEINPSRLTQTRPQESTTTSTADDEHIISKTFDDIVDLDDDDDDDDDDDEDEDDVGPSHTSTPIVSKAPSVCQSLLLLRNVDNNDSYDKFLRSTGGSTPEDNAKKTLSRQQRIGSDDIQDVPCWRAANKVIEKNKSLEDAVNESRVEITELRNMMNSAMSVRMESGC